MCEPYKQHAEREYQERQAACRFFLKSQIRPLVVVLLWKLSVGYILHRRDGLAAAVAGCIGADDVG